MKTFKELMLEFGNMKIDIELARKNKIFKKDEKESEKILFALIRDGFMNISWDVSSQGWEMMTQSPRGKIQYWHGDSPLETLQQIKKTLRIKV